MLPEPTEISKITTNISNPSDLVNTSQYGFPANQLPTADHRGASLDEDAASASSPGDQSPSDAELRGQLSRLSLEDSGETRPKPSFQRISEYESAFSPSPPKKHNGGPGFKVVKKAGNSLDGPQLENFPNGNSLSFSRSSLF